MGRRGQGSRVASRSTSLAPGRFVYGNSDEVVATLQEWEQITGADYVALRMRHPGGPGHAETLEAIRRFGAEVIPKIS